MDLALSIAKSGMEAQHKNLEIISNNLANANTPSFKKSRAEYQDLPYEIQQLPGSPTSQDTNTPAGFMLGTGTKIVGNSKIYSDGELTETKRDKDIAIHGRGFFQVQLPNGGGFAYTRDGSFQANETGELTTSNGYVLQPPITLPQGYTSLQISQDGMVNVTSSTGVQTQVGQIQLADFLNPDGLQPLGGNLYLATTSSGTETLGNPGSAGYGDLYQNMIEGSNVNVVEEMVNLIEAQRAFEVTSKAVSSIDSMMEKLDQVT